MAESLTSSQIFLGKLAEIILANLDNEEFCAEELAHESGISLYRLNRILLNINGKTASQVIREVRFQKALELLQNEAYSVSEVAYKSGFSSPSYFIARFHQQFGYSPGEVKKAGFKRDEVDKSPAAPSKQKAGGNVSRVFFYISVAILFFTSLTFLAYSIFTGSDSSNIPNLSKSPDKSITLLPFLILGNSIDDQLFIEGLIDEIYIDLGKIGELRVIPKMSTEKYIKTSQSLFETAKKLNADYIISVSGQKYRDLFRFRIQLIDRLNDKQLWSKSFDVDTSNITDIFSLQSQMAQSIVTEVEEVITP